MSKTSKFIDQARIFVKAGSGGNGHVGFHRARFIPKGGPSGGDGGNGGDVNLVGSAHLSTLLDFQYKRHFMAKNGEPGGTAEKTGANGSPVEIRIPLGTVILDDESGEVIGEILAQDQSLTVEEGGRGGLGNVHFKSSTNRTPRQSTPGEVREGRWIRLELRLIADIGIVGLPNAGKSTLLSTISAAHPKIADYPFTTLSPALGVIQGTHRSITLADMPGLIEGAHQGAGLGFSFLRHIRRTRALLYLTAANPDNPEQAWLDYQTTRNEIHQYDAEMASRIEVLALNKTDLLSPEQLDQSIGYFSQKDLVVWPISAKEAKGLDSLVSQLDHAIP